MSEEDAVESAFRSSFLSPLDFSFRPKPGPPTPLRTFVSDDLILTVGVDEEGQRLNRIECRCRAWAQRHEIRVPVVLDVADDGSWLLAQRIHTAPAQGPAFVHAALEAAQRIASHPAPALEVPTSRWRASRTTLPARLVRSVVGRLNPWEFVRARSEAEALTDTTTSHGDFYRRNVLAVHDGGVAIVDWEFVGPAARWTDHIRLWSTLRRAEDRRIAWAHITSSSGASDPVHLAVLLRWLTLRLLAENLAAPVAQRNPADLAHARLVVQEAREISAGLR